MPPPHHELGPIRLENPTDWRSRHRPFGYRVTRLYTPVAGSQCPPDFKCQLRLPGCKAVADEVDHSVPREVGGVLYDEANLRASCGSCNRSRGNRAGTPLGSMAIDRRRFSTSSGVYSSATGSPYRTRVRPPARELDRRRLTRTFGAVSSAFRQRGTVAKRADLMGGPLTCASMVAGAGFEPATFGL